MLIADVLDSEDDRLSEDRTVLEAITVEYGAVVYESVVLGAVLMIEEVENPPDTVDTTEDEYSGRVVYGEVTVLMTAVELR